MSTVNSPNTHNDRPYWPPRTLCAAGGFLSSFFNAAAASKRNSCSVVGEMTEGNKVHPAEESAAVVNDEEGEAAVESEGDPNLRVNVPLASALAVANSRKGSDVSGGNDDQGASAVADTAPSTPIIQSDDDEVFSSSRKASLESLPYT